MGKYRAIPEGYMRIGDAASRAGITVRTLQHYDKEGLLTPSAKSEGGFRLYSNKDMVRLTQILLMKMLGFSLAEIKTRLLSLDTPADVANVLATHAESIREKIAHLTDSLKAIETLKEEVEQTKEVNFIKYTGILLHLQKKIDNYQMIKHLDDETMEQVQIKFDTEQGLSISEEVNRCYDRALELKNAGVSPESKEAREFVKAFWEKLLELAGGDTELLLSLNRQVENTKDLGWDENLTASRQFIDAAFEAYFKYQEGEHA